jgi:hypothetical protein
MAMVDEPITCDQIQLGEGVTIAGRQMHPRTHIMSVRYWENHAYRVERHHELERKSLGEQQ